MRQITLNRTPKNATDRIRRSRRGFSLIESVLALSILAITFTAIASAIGAGSSSAMEERDQVTATLATEELLAEILAEEWDQLSSWNGFEEAPGESFAPDGGRYPSRSRIWRSAVVLEHTLQIEPAGKQLEGRIVRITTRNTDGRVLVAVDRFVPRPGGAVQ
ncbi:MAG: hypothetical protein CBC35_10900 [Planctomycetes bacterium TMED75]|nr:hypothetical protein [Planctomycetaceae bacterium]OUU90760.1 MAG: hypothetical protein CBC35_10900 [Planctomycetes bacterium TMED75]